jgi:hypothetical protein
MAITPTGTETDVKNVRAGMVVKIDIGYGPHSYEAPVTVTTSAEVHRGLFGDERVSFSWRYGGETGVAEFDPRQRLEVERWH